MLKKIIVSTLIIFILLQCTACNKSPKGTPAKTDESSSLKRSTPKDNQKDTSLNEDIVSNKSSEKNSVPNETDNELKADSNKHMFTMLFGGNKPEFFDTMAAEVEKKCDLDLKLDFKWCQFSKYNYRKRTALEANELDLYIPPKYWYKHIDEYKELTDLLPKYAPIVHNYIKSDDSLAAYTVDDRLIFMPDLYDRPMELLVDFKEEYVEKYNITNINNFEEYIEILKKIKEAEGIVPSNTYIPFDLVRLIMHSYGYNTFDVDYLLFYKIDDPELKLIPIENIPQFEHTISLITDAMKNGLIKFKNDDNVSHLYQNNGVYLNGNRYTFSLYPKQQLTKHKAKLVFANTSNDVEVILKFFNWLYSDQDNYDLFHYGIKNQHYTLKEDIVHTPSDKPEYLYSYNNLLKHNDYARQFSIFAPYDKRSDYNVANAICSPHEGFYMSNTPSYTRKEILKDLMIAVGSGKCSQIELEAYKNELSTKGTPQKVLDTYQKRLNEWLSTK